MIQVKELIKELNKLPQNLVLDECSITYVETRDLPHPDLEDWIIPTVVTCHKNINYPTLDDRK